MSVRFSSSTQRLVRTTSPISMNADYTAMGLVYITVDTNTYQTFWGLSDDTTSNFDTCGTTANGTTFMVGRTSGGVGTFVENTGTDLALNRWYHWCVVRSGNNLTGYLNGVQNVQITSSISGRAANNRAEFGGALSSNTSRLDGRLQFLKVWQVALTLDEIRAEMIRVTPKRLQSIYCFLPCLPGARGQDWGGTNNHFTESGTLTDEDNAPVPWTLQAYQSILPMTQAASIAANVLGLAVSVPAVGVAGKAVVSPSAQGEALSTPAPTVSGKGRVTPAAKAVALTQPAPTVAAKATTSPAAVSETIGKGAPAVAGKATAAPSAVGVTDNKGTPSVSGKGNVSPSAVGVTDGKGVPSVGSVTRVNAAALSVAESAGVPAISGKGNVSPSTKAVTTTLPAPAAGTVTRVSPAAVGSTDTPLNPTVSGKAVVSPSAQGEALSTPAPAVAAKANTSPSAVTVTEAAVNPTVRGKGNVSPTAAGVSDTLPSPSIGTDSSVTVNAVARSMTVTPLAPSVSGAARLDADAIALNWALGSPVPHGKANVSISSVLGVTLSIPAAAVAVNIAAHITALGIALSIPAPVVRGKAQVSASSVGLLAQLIAPSVIAARAPDERYYTVPAESRVLIVSIENRLYLVPVEDRTYEVD